MPSKIIIIIFDQLFINIVLLDSSVLVYDPYICVTYQIQKTWLAHLIVRENPRTCRLMSFWNLIALKKEREIYLFVWKVVLRGELEKEREIFYVLSLSQNVHISQIWATLKPGARIALWDSHVFAIIQELVHFSIVFTGTPTRSWVRGRATRTWTGACVGWHSLAMSLAMSLHARAQHQHWHLRFWRHVSLWISHVTICNSTSFSSLIQPSFISSISSVLHTLCYSQSNDFPLPNIFY